MLRLHNVAMIYPNGVSGCHADQYHSSEGSVPRAAWTLRGGQIDFASMPEWAGYANPGRCHCRRPGFDFPESPLAAGTSPTNGNDFPATSSDWSPFGATKRSARPRRCPRRRCALYFRCRVRIGAVALQSLERVGLVERALDRVDELSGGQQQRIGIARAMAQQPQIVLADEPVASFDPASGEKVLADLHRICREDGITTIVSLHQVELARRFADRVIGLAGGRIVFEGTASQLGQTILDQIYTTVPSRMAAA